MYVDSTLCLASPKYTWIIRKPVSCAMLLLSFSVCMRSCMHVNPYRDGWMDGWMDRWTGPDGMCTGIGKDRIGRIDR